MENTKIAWCDHTFNPWVGCEAVSAGCERCYARAMHERWNGKGAFLLRRRTREAAWRKPLGWNFKAAQEGRRVRVFCGSMCDWLDDGVPVAWLKDLMDLVSCTQNVDWLMLTKRPQNFVKRMREARPEFYRLPRNVWFGVTAEDQQRWDERVEILRGVAAAVRWVSAEPLLGPLNVWRCGASHVVDWVVAGGENGAGARPCEKRWITDLCKDVRMADRPFFFKQWGKRSVAGDVTAEFSAQVEGVRMWPGDGAAG